MASSDWTTTTLGQVIELKRGYDLPSRDRRDGPYPIVSSSGVSGCHAEAKAKAPGVVIGRYGTLGEVHYITQDYWPLNTSLYVRDFKGNDPRFISYFLRSLDFGAYSDKAAVPGLNRNDLHTAVVRVPAVAEQRVIAHILGTLDDKIELNRQMNETLESIARNLFKSWFIDFDPVRAKSDGRDPGLRPHLADLFPDSFEDSELGEIPKGWRVTGLDETATYLNGLALQKYPPNDGGSLPVIKIAQLRAGHTDGADRASVDIPPAYVVEDGDVLFSWSGSLEVEIWCGGRGALNQHLFKLTSGRFPKWFYFLWTRHHLPDFRGIAAGKATTMGHIQRGHLSAARALVPPPRLVEAMSAHFDPLLDNLIARRLQSRTLAALRDALLPKLIAGELRVSDAERSVGSMQ
jgi:type I restriction enzyme, S subunit